MFSFLELYGTSYGYLKIVMFHVPSLWQESDVPTGEEGSTDVCQMLGMMDPWYERNVVSLLSLSSEVLCQVHGTLF